MVGPVSLQRKRAALRGSFLCAAGACGSGFLFFFTFFLLGRVQYAKAPAVGHIHDDLLGRTGGIRILGECGQELVQLGLDFIVQASFV